MIYPPLGWDLGERRGSLKDRLLISFGTPPPDDTIKYNQIYLFQAEDCVSSRRHLDEPLIFAQLDDSLGGGLARTEIHDLMTGRCAEVW